MQLTLSAGSGIGYAGPVPCFACCPEQPEEHQIKPVTYNCLRHSRHQLTWLQSGRSALGKCCICNIVASLLASV